MQRLDPVLAALAAARRCGGSAHALDELAALAQPVEDPLARLLLRQPLEAGSARDAAVGADAHRLGEAVVAADREVGRDRGPA